MVHIVAPQEPTGSLPLPPSDEGSADRLILGDHSTVDSSEITQSAVRGSMSPELGTENAENATTESAVLANEAERTLPPPTQTSVSHKPTSGAIDHEAEEYRRQIDGVWQSEATQRKKQIVLVAMLSLFGLITAGVVFSQFVRSWREQQTIAKSGNEKPQDSPPQSASPPAETAQPTDAPNTSAEVDITATQEAPPAEDKNSNAGTPPVTASIEPTQSSPPQTPPFPEPTDAQKPSMVPPLETGVIAVDRDTDSRKACCW
jgi:hypothetical protein